MGNWVQIIKSFLNLFLKANCPLCNRPAEAELCKYCQRQLQQCKFAKPEQFWQSDRVFAWGEYGGSLKRAIAAMKYKNHPELAQPLGYWLGETWQKSSIYKKFNKVTVIPIPMYPEKQRKRGFNQAELIAKHFCEYTKLPFQPQGLQRIRETQAQFNLNAAEREKNIEGAFRLGKAFVGSKKLPSKVLLLDDIYTTGATTRAAEKTLRASGIEVCGIAVIATTKKQNYKRE